MVTMATHCDKIKFNNMFFMRMLGTGSNQTDQHKRLYNNSAIIIGVHQNQIKYSFTVSSRRHKCDGII